MKLILVTFSILACSAAYGLDTKITYPEDPHTNYSIVSIEESGANRTVITKVAKTEFTTYVKREFNCSNSTVRYLGSSNTPSSFNPQGEDEYFSRVDITTLTALVGSEACREFPASQTTIQ